MMRVAIYIRVSSEEQAVKGNSLYEQEDRLKAYCKAMGWDEPVLYEDDGYSAKDLNRPAVTRLLEDVKQRKYNMVLTTKIDRLSRRLLDLLNLIDYLKKYDANYTSATESFDTSTPVGIMTLQILGSVAEFERQRIRERVRENLLSLAKQGKMIGKPPYGYNIVDGTYEVNIEESLIVKQIFQWTLENEGPLAIAGKLNAMGIPTKNNTIWNERRIREMLQLESYIGQFIYNRTYRKGTNIATRPEEEWIVTEDHHEPIIEESVFYKVQDILKARKRGAKQYHGDDRYLLSGLVYCTHCGQKMHGRQAQRPRKTIEDKVQLYYICSGYQKKGICFYHYVHRDDLEQFVVQEIKKAVKTRPERLNLILTEAPNRLSEKDLFMSKLTKLDNRMQKQIEAWEKDLISDHDLKLARQRIEEERKTIQKALDDLERVEAMSEQYRAQSKAKELLDDILSEDRVKMKTAISRLIHRVKVTDGQVIEVSWNRA